MCRYTHSQIHKHTHTHTHIHTGILVKNKNEMNHNEEHHDWIQRKSGKQKKLDI
jgi:hypothetical protein